MAYYVHGLEDEGLVQIAPGVQHTFLIRHPHKAIRSLYMKSCVDNKETGWDSFNPDEAGFVAMHALWQRARAADGGTKALVVDADDMLLHPEELMETFCSEAGLPTRADPATRSACTS